MTSEPPPAGDGTAAQERAYRDVFEAIASGENRAAARLLRDLNAAQLEELVVICGDVALMAGAQRVPRLAAPAPVPQDLEAALARLDASPRERRLIAGITDLIEAEDIIYAQALAATGRGDRDTAIELLRWCARTEIGESAWLLASALDEAGELAEALTWYARAASDGDERAAARLAAARKATGGGE